MKVHLVNPPLQGSRRFGLNGVIDTLFYNSPPLGLASLAAVLEQAGHQVAITDAAVERLDARGLVRRLVDHAPDLVGLTATTTQVTSALGIAHGLGQWLPRCRVVMGGPHITGHPELLLDNPALDCGVVGEGEITTRELVAAFAGGGDKDAIPGVVLARDGALHRAPPRPLIDDLDALPMPARHLLRLGAYRPLPNDQLALPKTSAIISRGCPSACIFCDKRTFGSRFRARSPALVVRELHQLVDRWGMRDVAFVDSTFTPTRARIEAVLSAMEAQPAACTWTASCRADLLDRGLLERMRDAGCWRIRIAIESGDPGILSTIRKGITQEQFAAAVHAAHDLGIQVKGFFMVGHIGETPQTLDASVRFACSLPLDDVTVQINTPMPGTPQYEICAEHGELVQREPERVTFFEPLFVPRGLTREQLLAAHRHFYRAFYLRPRIVRRLGRDLRQPGAVRKVLRAVPGAVSLMFANRGRR
jgi:anaerobic magnesium-protoporphyrin IX monomethyl ester cyclase